MRSSNVCLLASLLFAGAGAAQQVPQVKPPKLSERPKNAAALFLAFAGIVNYKQLLGFSRWFLLISVVLGAMLTPPDVVTQVLLAIPLMALYFISVLFAYLLGPKVEESPDD